MTTSLDKFDGIQIDMGLLNGISINTDQSTAWFQGGVYAREVIDALWMQGYVTSKASQSTPAIPYEGLIEFSNEI